ncbi:MAG: iron-sulfur cluster assembly scaffold protein [Alphaproteobacteria bacterium]|nr:MAG: iron-sulfur cluster assembly scaffold protein [Alphaproteobacteria bacterium]
MNDLTIYHKKILELASINRKSLEINDFNFSKEVKNPLCGDLVEVRINIINNSIKNLSAKVKGCALCEASAGLVVNYFSNKKLPTNDFMEHFNKWLSKIHDNYPYELPEELKIFSPIQDIKNRHTCVKMPFEAFFKSIKNF